MEELDEWEEDSPWLGGRPCASRLNFYLDRVGKLKLYVQQSVLLNEERQKLHVLQEKLMHYCKIVKGLLYLAQHNVRNDGVLIDLFHQELFLGNKWACGSMNGIQLLIEDKGEQYRIGREIHGNPREQRFVYEGRQLSTSRDVIVKKLSKENIIKIQNMEERQVCMRILRREFVLQNLLKPFCHENILCFDRYYENENWIYAIFPRAELSLSDFVFGKRGVQCTVGNITSIFSQMVSAVEFLLNLGFVHRDLKLDNFVIDKTGQDSYHIRLIDFGLSSSVGLENVENGVYGLLSGHVGTPAYMAPEVFRNSTPSQAAPYHAEPAEVWSLGICFVTFACGRTPYAYPGLLENHYRILHSFGARKLMKELLQKDLTRANPHFFQNENLIKLVELVLVVQPQMRLSLSDIFQKLFAI